ncbi:AAA family ATPase [Streptomyces sp. SID12488]|uniref:helix-turn-helix transcriptional regulator n=1 Tax=Streptomyces sp. SID12488 TaxID=2706040 RepID=UPI0031B9DF54
MGTTLYGLEGAFEGAAGTSRKNSKKAKKAQGARVSLSSPALVGRGPELNLLTEVGRSAGEGRGSSVFVLGEPGIGKSRLVEEAVAAAARTGSRVLRGRAASAGRAVPLRPLAEAVFSGLRGEGAPADGDLGPYEPLLSRLCGLAPQDGAPLVGYAEAVLRLLGVLGRTHGCLLVLEDLHDADADTLTIVDYLTDNLPGQRAALLATLRGGPGPALDLAEAAVSRRAARTLRLARLGPAHTAELAARCLGHDDAGKVPAAVLDRLHAVSEGVPFVVEELLQAMVDSGNLVRTRNDGWTVTGALNAGVPTTVAAAVLQRVDHLEPPGIALLEAAAVLGRRFPVDVAARVAELDRMTALRQLRHAARAHLVTDGATAEQPGWHSFRHALTADAIAHRLLPAERAALCLAAADAIEAADAAVPESGTDRPDRGGELRGLLGGGSGDDLYRLAAELCVAGGQPARAAALLTRASRQAVLRGALLTAVELLDRGLELTADATDTPPETVARLLEELLGTLVLTGDVQRVPELGDRLDHVLIAWGAPAARRAAGFLTRARAAATAQQWEEGLTAVRRARELLGAEPDAASRAALDAVAAHLVLGSQRPDRLESARVLAEGALAAAEAVGLPEVSCKALNILGYCLRPHDLAEAEKVFERLVSTAEAHALPVWRIRGLLELGALDRIRFTGTDRLLAARKAAEETGAVLLTAWADTHLTQAHVLRDDLDGALEYAERLRTTADRLRLREVQLIGVAMDAVIAASRGEREKLQAALHVLETALAGGSAGAVWGYADTSVWGWARGVCSLLLEEPDRAMAEFTEADRTMRALPSTRGVIGFLGPYLLLRTVRGAAGWAELDGAVADRLTQVHWDRPFVGWSRAVLLGREGRAAEAAKVAEEALAGTDTIPMARHLCLRLGAQAALTDDWGQPVEWLRAAEQFFHDRGTTRMSAACRALLREAGSPVPRRRQGHDTIPPELRRTGVTAREYEVLRLLGRGLGNQEIAQQLFLSPRTVEKHLASLRDRTGQSSRTALRGLARRYSDGQ